jgi:hypothetical protein
LSKIVDTLAEDPECGDELPGTGGFRKLRVAGRGKGKSGGYRVVTFYSGEFMPVYLITIFSKGTKPNLTRAEQNELKAVGKLIVAAYKGRVTALRRA